MKIWYLSAHDQPHGRSLRTYDFCRELVTRGHSVTMFTNSYCHWTHKEHLSPNEKWRIEQFEGIRVVWLRTTPYTGSGLTRGINMISNVLRSLQVERNLAEKPDVVIGPSVPLGTGWAAWRIANKNDAAFVFEVRDIWPAALVANGSISKISPIYLVFRLIEKLLYSKANKISAVLPLTHQHVEASGFDPKKVVWIPNGIYFKRFEAFQAYDGGNSSSLKAMYVGSLTVLDDVVSIIRAAQLLRERGVCNYNFIIVGDGPNRSQLENEVKNLSLENIQFWGSVPKSKIPEIQSQADVLIACITDSPIYRFGINLNKIFDYLASARPIIFSGKAPNDPIAESGCGFSVTPQNPKALANALEKMICFSPQERVQLGARGFNYAKNKFNISVLAKHMEDILIQALQDKEKSKCS